MVWLVGKELCMVWPGGHGMIYGIAWRPLPLIFTLKYYNIMAIKINIDSFVALSFVCFFCE